MSIRELLGLFLRPLGAVAAVTAVALLGHALWPSASGILAVALALLVLLVELGRTRAVLQGRLSELEADVAQMEPLLMLGSRLSPRRPLPPMRGYAIAPDFALMLTNLVADERPELVVETGSGVSTLIIAYALEKLGRGKVVALEHDAVYAEKTREEIERHGLTRYAKVVHAPLEPLEIDGERYVWYARSALEGLDDVDLVVDDGPPKYLGKMLRYASFPVFSRRLSRRGLFVLDAIGREEPKVIERWKAEFPEYSFERLATKKGNLLARPKAA